MHKRLGPIVRLAPNEVSVNDLESVRTIYAGGFEKDDWFANIFSAYGGIKPLFAMPSNAEHSRRKKTLGNVYTRSTLFASSALQSVTHAIVNDRLVPRLRDVARSGETVEFYDLFFALTIDYVAAYCFGIEAGSNLLSQPCFARRCLRSYLTRVKSISLPQELPSLTRWMERLGLLPSILPLFFDDCSFDWDTEAWLLEMQDKAERIVEHAEKHDESRKRGQWPTVYAQLRHNLLAEQDGTPAGTDGSVKQLTPASRLVIASEMLDQVFAGVDTVSIVLLFLAWELSKPENVTWQDKLRSEVAPLADCSDARAIDSLPILHAIVMETLRLHAPNPGSQVRVTPSNEATFSVPGQPPVTLPPNVRVHAQAWSLHRNSPIFPDAECWKPDRWLDCSVEHLRQMNRWFWAFGSGSRMCAGMNLAVIELKAVTVGIWRQSGTELVDGAGMVHNGGFIARPLGVDGTYLKLRLNA